MITVLSISPTTISFVLNGQAAQMKVSETTVQRVREAAERLGYRPSYHARTLTSGRCFTLGLALEDQSVLGHRFWGPVATGICEAAKKESYELLLIMGRSEETAFARGIRFLQEKRLDALLVLGGAAPGAAGDARLPIVIIQGNSDDYPTVLLNPAPGIDEAIRHLAQLGHRDILRIGRAQDGADSTPDRLNAFRRAVRSAGVTGREWIVESKLGYSPRLEDHIAEYRQVLASSLRLESGTTAILCYNDTMALALYSVLAERGLRIPDDISVIGFDDLHASHAIPALTTISHSLSEMGAKAVEIALSQLGEKITRARSRATSKNVAAKLVIRQSTAVARSI